MGCERNRYPVRDTLEKLTEEIVGALRKAGFHVLYYKSATSNSRYIKLDYGACGSLRISDHPGKAKYTYRYNLLTIQKKYEVVRDRRLERYFYGLSHIDEMVLDMQADRRFRQARENGRWYRQMMDDGKSKCDTKADGFWNKCRAAEG